jgi:flavin reductase (DIM6/NTAB) family NADH-FMN oxidoreductase RutF
MHIVNQFGETLKRFVFGSTNLRQQCAIGLRDPQAEVRVWLHGLGAPRDVTCNHVMAAGRPLTLGIGLGDEGDAAIIGRSRPSLQFREGSGEKRLLGEITLEPTEVITVRGEYLGLFETRSYRNYCLPSTRLWAFYSYYAYRRWRAWSRPKTSGFRMVTRELHTVFVFYICPRPVVLVSVTDGNVSNIFPMDLIGPIGNRHFSLALHNTSTAVPLIERSRRAALSSVPVEQTEVAYELGKNHKKPCVDWADVPFLTTLSATFRLPVPRFSLRVREMQIEAVRDVGSHKLFLAETIKDQQWADGLQLFFVHGIYQARDTKTPVKDSQNKEGLAPWRQRGERN